MTTKPLEVRPHKIGGYGITRGRKWFAWTYKTHEDAQTICARLQAAGERAIAVNVARDEPIGPAPLTSP